MYFLGEVLLSFTKKGTVLRALASYASHVCPRALFLKGPSRNVLDRWQPQNVSTALIESCT